MTAPVIMDQMKIKEINIPIYKHRVTLISGDLDTVATYLTSLYYENLNSLDLDWDSAEALCFIIKNDIYIWWNGQVSTPVLGHEVIHATYAIMKQRGLSFQDQECTCYIWQYIMEQALSTLRPIQMDRTNPASIAEDIPA